MTRHGAVFALSLVAACAVDDAEEIEARDDEDGDEDEDVEEPTELASEDDPAFETSCTYVAVCSRPAQELQPVLVCNWPPLEPWNPLDPGDPEWPPLEPWTPLVVEPDLDRISSDVEPVAHFPWPPPGCHEELVSVDVVHTVECKNRCGQPAVEDCVDMDSGEVWSHTKLHRPAEFFDCEDTDWEPCNTKNPCSL